MAIEQADVDKLRSQMHRSGKELAALATKAQRLSSRIEEVMAHLARAQSVVAEIEGVKKEIEGAKDRLVAIITTANRLAAKT